jgi:hypothetical protein
MQRAVALLDIAQHTAGADRGELFITNQPDTRTASDGELHRRLSRIGRVAGSVPGRSANRIPNVSRRCCSRAML